MKKLVRESLNENRSRGHNKKVSTTVDELLTWYNGDEDWVNDWQTTNTMAVDGRHAQEIDEEGEGMAIVKWLADNKDDSIIVKSVETFHGDWELTFELDGKTVEIVSMSYALDPTEI